MTIDCKQAIAEPASDRTERFVTFVAVATPRRRWLIAFVLGALSVLAMPPFGLWPILGLTLPGLVLLLDTTAPIASVHARLRHAGAIGWWFGFGYFLPGLYWIGSAFLVEADRFAWLMPFAVTAMPAGLGLFFAAGLAAACLCWCPGPNRILVLTVALSASEWLRGTIFTGFPWNALGYALTSQEALLQAAALVGVHGLTVLTVLTLSTPVLLLGPRSRQDRRWCAVAGLVLVGLVMAGLWRVPAAPMPTQPGLDLLLVQPDTPEAEKFRPDAQRGIFARLLAMSDAGSAPGRLAASARRRLVIWPETPVNAWLIEDSAALAAIARLLGPDDRLITGTVRRPQFKAESRNETWQPYNSLVVIDNDGAVVAVYDKAHLVPFGEYLPFQSSLEAVGLESLTRQRGGFASGPGVRTIALPGIPAFSPLICYEVIFPSAVVDRAHRPDWLLNITNDAWFGVSTGPYQHLQQARVRAVEEGLPLVRVAGTGITAVIDPYGRIVDRLGLETAGVIRAALPLPLPPTIYASFGDLGFGLALAVLLSAIWTLNRPLNRQNFIPREEQ